MLSQTLFSEGLLRGNIQSSELNIVSENSGMYTGIQTVYPRLWGPPRALITTLVPGMHVPPVLHVIWLMATTSRFTSSLRIRRGCRRTWAPSGSCRRRRSSFGCGRTAGDSERTTANNIATYIATTTNKQKQKTKHKM